MPADTVFTNCEIYNPFACGFESTSLAVQDGLVAGLGDYAGREEIDLGGSLVVPGLIDAHVHIESSLLTPAEFARLVLRHGTTTVVTDPHEIANVCGAAGIEYILRESAETSLDVLVMLPSCVPATPFDMGGASLSADDLREFCGQGRVIGLAEMMNVPGVLAADPEIERKLDLCEIVDGHAPLLTGKDLNAYVYAGITSDHECTLLAEAREKLRRGMYIMLREGSTERNLAELLPVVTGCTSSRCCFATDDRHADMLLAAGHIDDCIRKAVAQGCEIEIALRMATLSAAERFGLHDRGALAPGRLADFCVVDDLASFRVSRTFKRGIEVIDPGYRVPAAIRRPLVAVPPDADTLRISGSGSARVIGLVEGQIITEDLRFEVNGDLIPDTDRDILKAVVTDRYRGKGSGVGLVHGFSLTEGALASSVSHDSHNIVAVGVDDADIIGAIARGDPARRGNGGGRRRIGHDAAARMRGADLDPPVYGGGGEAREARRARTKPERGSEPVHVPLVPRADRDPAPAGDGTGRLRRRGFLRRPALRLIG